MHLGIDVSALSDKAKSLMQSLLLYGCRCPSRIGKLPIAVLMADPANFNPYCGCLRKMKVPDDETRCLLRWYQLVLEKHKQRRPILYGGDYDFAGFLDYGPPLPEETEEDHALEKALAALKEDFAPEEAPASEETPVAGDGDKGATQVEAPAPLSGEANEDNAATLDVAGALPEESNQDSSTPRPPQDGHGKYSCHRACGKDDSWQNMVGCETEHAPNGRWFHFSCAGLATAPEPNGKI